jgi:hypothetical protein
MLRAQGTFVAMHGIVELRTKGQAHQTAVRPAAGSRQLVEQSLRFFQVGGVEALGE